MKRLGLAAIALTVVIALPGWLQVARAQAPQQIGDAQQVGDDGSDFDGNAPDHGVARLSLLQGDVTIKRGDTGEAIAGELNAPLVALDHVLTPSGARAEIQLDYSNMVRVGPASEVRLGDLKDGNYLLQVADGTITFRVLRDTSSVIEISTPTVSVRPLEKGTYRITVRPDGSTEVTVRKGQAEIYSSRGTEKLGSGKTMEARGTANDPDYMVTSAISKDDWDRWNETRDQDLERSQSYRYVSRDISGADDLDGHGRWVNDSQYGNVWVPNVAAGWAPYREGRWSYVDYYGWSWLSADPWGWAPYHYGSWYNSSYGWAWYPGVIGPRYYWRPAMVSFFGWGSGGYGYGGGVNIGFGFGNVGWVPLAPYEVYRPWYGRGGYGYGGRTTIVNNVNITNVYRNARGGNGVTSVRSGDFGRGRVGSNNFVRASGNDFSRAGEVRGRLPLQASNDSRRFSDRSANVNGLVQSNRSNSDFAQRPGRQNAQNNGGGLANGNSNRANNGGAVTRANNGGAAARGNNNGQQGLNNGSGNRPNTAELPSRVNGQAAAQAQGANRGQGGVDGQQQNRANVNGQFGQNGALGNRPQTAAELPSRVNRRSSGEGGQTANRGEISGNGNVNRGEIAGNGNARSFGESQNGGFSRRVPTDTATRGSNTLSNGFSGQGSIGQNNGAQNQGGFNRSSESGRRTIEAPRSEAPRSSGFNPGNQGVRSQSSRAQSSSPVFRSAPSAPSGGGSISRGSSAPSGGGGGSRGGGGGSISRGSSGPSGGGGGSRGGGGSGGGGGRRR